MRFTVLLSLLCSSQVLAVSTTKTTCNYVTLVRCFITILDEWAWTLYELKDNVVTITEDQCVHLKALDKCVQDDFEQTGQHHKCTHSEVLEVSNTVSDLLTHRTKSGSFLKSYYLLTYACSPQGQEVLTNHRECLRQEKIGEMTLAAGTYLTERFLNDVEAEDAENPCILIQNKLNEYVTSMSGLCKNEAADIMCKSLTSMFKGLHADKVSDCNFTCPTLAEPTEEAVVDMPQEKPGEQDAQQGPAKTSPVLSLLLSTSTIFFARAILH